MAYKKILVAVDCNESSSALFDKALELALKDNSELKVFHCIRQNTAAELEDRVGTFSEIDQSDSHRKRVSQINHEVEHIKAWLEGFCTQAKARGITARAQVAVGKPGPDIVDIAGNWGADLVVLGRTNRGRLTDILLGRASYYVVHHAQCSVLLVQKKV